MDAQFIKTLGTLEEAVRAGNAQRSKLFDKIDALDKDFANHRIEFREHAAEEAAANKRLEKLEGTVADNSTWINRIKYGSLGVLVMAAGGGAASTDTIKGLLAAIM